MTTAALLSLLRTLLHDVPSAAAWDRLCACLGSWPEESVTVGVEYAAPFLDEWPETLRTAPLDWLRTAVDGGVDPRWSLVRNLSLAGWINGAEPLVTLSECGALDAVTRLDLSRCVIGDDGVRALVTMAGLRVERLELAGNGIGPQGVSALCEGTLGSRLEYLDLADNALGHHGAAALASAPFPQLRHLDLSNTDLGPHGAIALFAAASFPQLASLSLWRNGIGPEAAATVVESTAFPRLRTLDLAANELTEAAGDSLLEGNLLARLESVNLATNKLGAELVEALRATFPQTSLNLSGNVEPPRRERW